MRFGGALRSPVYPRTIVLLLCGEDEELRDLPRPQRDAFSGFVTRNNYRGRKFLRTFRSGKAAHFFPERRKAIGPKRLPSKSGIRGTLSFAAADDFRRGPPPQARGGVAKDLAPQRGFLKEVFREDGGVRATRLESPPPDRAPFGGVTMEDSRRRLDNDLGARPSKTLRRRSGSSPEPMRVPRPEARVEVTEAVEGLTPNRHVGVTH